LSNETSIFRHQEENLSLMKEVQQIIIQMVNLQQHINNISSGHQDTISLLENENSTLKKEKEQLQIQLTNLQ
jgi:hypothetical protein